MIKITLTKNCKKIDDLILDNPIIICNEEQRFIVAEQMSKQRKPKNILLEPLEGTHALVAALKLENGK